MDKQKFLSELRTMVNNQTQMLIDVQKAMLSPTQNFQAFDMLNEVIQQNFDLWNELYALDGSAQLLEDMLNKYNEVNY
jgi:hypothetical protein